ncbi:unnamed protein product, partial [marine sediment metagenome]
AAELLEFSRCGALARTDSAQNADNRFFTYFFHVHKFIHKKQKAKKIKEKQ